MKTYYCGTTVTRRLLLLVVGTVTTLLGPGTRGANPELIAVRQTPLPAVDSRLEWDASRGVLYCSDQSWRRVLKISLATGETLGELPLTNPPDHLALSPDGTELFVAQPIRPHNHMWIEDQWGYVVVVDPDTLTKLRQFRVEIDPFDVAPTADGTVAVSSGSGQWTYLDTYDSQTGEFLGRQSGVIDQLSRLTLSADSQRLYVSSYGGLQRLDRNPDTGAFWRPGNPVLAVGSHPRVWLHPTQDLLLDSGSQVFRSGTDPAHDLEWLENRGRSFTDLAFDVPNRTYFTVGEFGLDGFLDQWNLDTLEQATTYPLPRAPKGVFVDGDLLWVVTVNHDGDTALRVYENPAAGSGGNQPPQPNFTWTPEAASTLEPIELDGSSTTDDAGPEAALWFRWDLDGDGVFDTEFSETPTVTLFPHTAREKPVTLEARDSQGATGQIRKVVPVQLEEDAGEPVPEHDPWLLPFVATRIAVDAERQRLYATDTGGERLWVVDLTTGLALRRFDFFLPAESLTMSPDGRRLAVALLGAPHDSFRDDDGSGYLAVFDLERLVKTHEIAVAVDPGSVLLTDAGFAIAGGGSSQSTLVQSYRVDTGDLAGQANISQGMPTVLLPSQTAFLALWKHSSGAVVFHYTVDPVDGSLGVRGDLSQDLDGCRNGSLALNEAGDLCATAQGSVFRLSPEGGVLAPAIPLGSGLSQAVVFDVPARGMMFGAFDLELIAINTTTFLPAKTEALEEPVAFLERIGDDLLLVSVRANETRIRRRPSPALGSEGNQAPDVDLLASSGRPTLRELVTFSAGTTTDDRDAPEQLQFRWDTDGDGTFDISWGPQNAYSHRFLQPGQKVLVVEARDSWGAVGRAELAIEVGVEEDAGDPVLAHEAWRLPYAIADAAFDPERPDLWVSDPSGQAVVRVDLNTGLEQQRWGFGLDTESLAIRPDGTRLYAALLTRPHMSAWRDQIGYVAEFDLTSRTLMRILQLPIDPGDLLATDSGLLIVAPGSGTPTGEYVTSYRLRDLAMLGGADIGHGARIRLAPSQTAVYGATYWDINPFLMRFNFDLQRGTLAAGPKSPSYGLERESVGGQVLVLPDEHHVLGGGGGVYLSQAGDPNDLRVVEEFPLKPALEMATFPGDGPFMVTSGPRLGYFDRDTREPIHLFQLGRPAQWLGVGANEHYAVGVSGELTVIQRRVLPPESEADNQPPRVQWLGPENNAAFAWPSTVHLEVEVEDVDGGVESVRFLEGEDVLGEATAYPFGIEVSTLSQGDHVISAVAWDDRGVSNAPVTLPIRLTFPPTVDWITPVHPAVLDQGDDLFIEVGAEDADGTVARVEFFRDQVEAADLLGTASEAPWTFTLTEVAEPFTLLARAVDNDGVASAPISVLIQLAGATGDDFYRPFQLTGIEDFATASNRDATIQFDEQNFAATPVHHTLWWSWTAPVTGIYEVDTLGSNFDTVLGVFTGTDIGQLHTVAVSDDDLVGVPRTRVKFLARAGTKYRFAVDGYYNAVGEVTLNLALQTAAVVPPPNDDFANRIPLAGTDLTIDATNVAAGPETGEKPHAGVVTGPSVWWEWIAPTNGLLHLDTAGSGFDTVLALYTVSGSPVTLSRLSNFAANDDDPAGGLTSSIDAAVVAGRTYFLAITGFGEQTGDIHLALAFEPGTEEPPANDDFENRLLLKGPKVFIEASNLNATSEPGEPRVGSLPPNATVWYQWRSPVSGPVYLLVKGVGVNVRAAVFTGSQLGNLNRLAVSGVGQKPGIVVFEAVEKDTYSFAVDADQPPGGVFTLALNVGAPRQPPQLAFGEPGSDGSLVLDLPGFSGGTVVLFRSEDLIEWIPIRTNHVGPGSGFEISPTASSRAFFKVRVE